MDPKTLKSYDKSSKLISEAHLKLTPTSIYELALKHFIKGGPTADIGCGTGRDTNWLNKNNFPSTGFDGSKGMLDSAIRFFPENDFKFSNLPDLSEISDQAFTNILCSAVIMHLQRSDLDHAVRNLCRISDKAGTIILSFRSTTSPEKREDDRLYEDLSCEELMALFKHNECDLLYTEEVLDNDRPGISWTNLVLKKKP